MSFPAAHIARAQTNPLVVNQDIVLPKDDGQSLVSALNGFLEFARKPNDENEYVWDAEKLETYVLLDEINDIEKNVDLKDDHFYKPYLTNVVELEDDQFCLQVSFMGTQENKAILRASFEFVAHKTRDNSFQFSSPLVRNTKNWKVDKIGNNVFHYRYEINKEQAQLYAKLAFSFDKKLKSGNKVTKFYCCENLRR